MQNQKEYLMNQLFDCYSRLLIDNHISDHKPEYMKRFSPEEYVRLVKCSGVESSMVYACDHNGNCYYPSKVGHVHNNLGGRDIFGETVALLKQNGIVPVAYTTVTYHNDCARKFPAARIVDMRGNRRDGRYHFTCPNQPEAVEFYKQQIREIAAYDVNGIFIDMTFWPAVCCCDGCRKKYGKDFPEQIHWRDPEWVAFQRFREKSMADFAAELTEAAREIKPEIAVTHQFSPVLHGWYLGQSDGIAEASDYASGDFYGNKLQQRFAVKAFQAYTQKPPYEFMTSRCVNLRDHTSSKCDQELFLSALTTLANGGAYFFIDAINPDGTLSESFYQRIGSLNRELAPFREIIEKEKFQLDGEIGLFFSISCCVDNHLNGKTFREFCGGSSNNMEIRQNAVQDEILGTAEILNKMHLPFRIVKDFSSLSGLKALIINKAAYLSGEDCNAIREFVRNGGTLIATGDTSLMDLNGNSSGEFQLAELFGVNFQGEYSDTVTYTGKDLILAKGEVPLVSAAEHTEILEYLSLPDFPVQDPDHYASIHSDPPGTETTYPALTVNRFGAGRCIWLAAPIFLLRQHTQQEFGKKLFRNYLPSFPVEIENLSESAEVTWLVSADRKKHLLCIVNVQDEFPVIPLHDVRITFPSGLNIGKIIRVSDGIEQEFISPEDSVIITDDKITTGEFFLCQP